eukprot:18710-Pleurochrysis_carterae.AAC.2
MSRTFSTDPSLNGDNAAADVPSTRPKAKRKALQRTVRRIQDALPDDDEKAAEAFNRFFRSDYWRGRKLLKKAGLVLAEQQSVETNAFKHLRGNVEKMRQCKQFHKGVCQKALQTIFTMMFLSPDEFDEAVQQNERTMRGKEAKAAIEQGLQPPAAQVVGFCKLAEATGLSKTTVWRHTRDALAQKQKVPGIAEELYEICALRRTGHGLDDDTKALVHNYYIDHANVKRSPIKGNVIYLRDKSGVKQPVAKLLCEVSITLVYDDFLRDYPDMKVHVSERSSRSLAPAEMRRITKRHLNMCGCRCEYCTLPMYYLDMKYAQEALNASRKMLSQQHVEHYSAPYCHEHPKHAAAAAVCNACEPSGTDAAGMAPMKDAEAIFCCLSTFSYWLVVCWLGWCESCGVNKLDTHPLEEDTGINALKVPFYHYKEMEKPTSYLNDDGTPKMTKHLTLNRDTLPIGEFMKHYRKTLAYYVYHCNYVRMSSMVRLERLGLKPGEISLIMDFSEKLSKKQHKQAQSQHWDTVAMTLEVAVVESYKASLSDEQLVSLAQALLTDSPR